MYIPFTPGAPVSRRETGKQRKTGDAREFIPEARDEPRCRFGDLDELLVLLTLFNREFRVGRRRINRVRIGERVTGGPKQGLARQSFGWLVSLHLLDRTK